MNIAPEKLYYLLREAASMMGTFEPSEIMPCIEEDLTLEEYEHCTNFLTWLVSNKKTYGSNVNSVWEEWASK